MGGAPFGDFTMVAREENVGDFFTAKIVGLGVLGIFEGFAVGKTFDFGGSFAAEDAWEEADDGVNDD